MPACDQRAPLRRILILCSVAGLVLPVSELPMTRAGASPPGNWGGGGSTMDLSRSGVKSPHRSIGSASSTVREGDWRCVQCNHNNWRRRNDCQMCGLAKSWEWMDSTNLERSPKPGDGTFSSPRRAAEDSRLDWRCEQPGCDATNFRRRSECYKCHRPRLIDADKRRAEPPPGSMTMEECMERGRQIALREAEQGNKYDGSKGRRMKDEYDPSDEDAPHESSEQPLPSFAKESPPAASKRDWQPADPRDYPADPRNYPADPRDFDEGHAPRDNAPSVPTSPVSKKGRWLPEGTREADAQPVGSLVGKDAADENDNGTGDDGPTLATEGGQHLRMNERRFRSWTDVDGKDGRGADEQVGGGEGGDAKESGQRSGAQEAGCVGDCEGGSIAERIVQRLNEIEVKRRAVLQTRLGKAASEGAGVHQHSPTQHSPTRRKKSQLHKQGVGSGAKQDVSEAWDKGTRMSGEDEGWSGAAGRGEGLDGRGEERGFWDGGAMLDDPVVGRIDVEGVVGLGEELRDSGKVKDGRLDFYGLPVEEEEDPLLVRPGDQTTTSPAVQQSRHSDAVGKAPALAHTPRKIPLSPAAFGVAAPLDPATGPDTSARGGVGGKLREKVGDRVDSHVMHNANHVTKTEDHVIKTEDHVTQAEGHTTQAEDQGVLSDGQPPTQIRKEVWQREMQKRLQSFHAKRSQAHVQTAPAHVDTHATLSHRPLHAQPDAKHQDQDAPTRPAQAHGPASNVSACTEAAVDETAGHELRSAAVFSTRPGGNHHLPTHAQSKHSSTLQDEHLQDGGQDHGASAPKQVFATEEAELGAKSSSLLHTRNDEVGWGRRDENTELDVRAQVQTHAQRHVGEDRASGENSVGPLVDASVHQLVGDETDVHVQSMQWSANVSTAHTRETTAQDNNNALLSPTQAHKLNEEAVVCSTRYGYASSNYDDTPDGGQKSLGARGARGAWRGGQAMRGDKSGGGLPSRAFSSRGLNNARGKGFVLRGQRGAAAGRGGLRSASVGFGGGNEIEYSKRGRTGGPSADKVQGVALVDGESCLELLGQWGSWLDGWEGAVGSWKVFVSRHCSQSVPERFRIHRASAAAQDAPTHALAFYAASKAPCWAESNVCVCIISRNDALQTAVDMLRDMYNIRASLASPASLATQSEFISTLSRPSVKVLAQLYPTSQ